MLILFLIIFLQDSWQSVTSIVKWYGDHQDEMIPVAGPGNWNDPDMVKKIKWFNYHSYTEKKKKKREKMILRSFWFLTATLGRQLILISHSSSGVWGVAKSYWDKKKCLWMQSVQGYAYAYPRCSWAWFVNWSCYWF